MAAAPFRPRRRRLLAAGLQGAALAGAPWATARAAGYVDRILRGAKRADLPVAQPSRFEVVVNRGAARRRGIVVPAAIHARADRIID